MSRGGSAAPAHLSPNTCRGACHPERSEGSHDSFWAAVILNEAKNLNMPQNKKRELLLMVAPVSLSVISHVQRQVTVIAAGCGILSPVCTG